MLDRFIRIDGELKFFRELSDLRRGPLEVECKRGPGLRAEHYVFCDGHSLDQHEVLVDHADAERDRVVRRFDLTHLTVNEYLATVGSIETIGDAHRRRLPSAIFTNDGVNGSWLNDYIDLIVRQ